MATLTIQQHAPSLTEVLDLPHDTLDQLMAAAYLLHSGGHYLHAEMVCRGMLAAEPRYWYAAALLAATQERRARNARPRVAARRPASHPRKRMKGTP
jgi:hypothetical protein